MENLLRLKKKKVVCLVSYEPPFCECEKLLPKWLSVFRFGGYLNFIKPENNSQGGKKSSWVNSTAFSLIGVLALILKTFNHLGYGMLYTRKVIRGYTFREANKFHAKEFSEPRRKNAYLYNNTHSVTYYVTSSEKLALLHRYSCYADFGGVKC